MPTDGNWINCPISFLFLLFSLSSIVYLVSRCVCVLATQQVLYDKSSPGTAHCVSIFTDSKKTFSIKTYLFLSVSLRFFLIFHFFFLLLFNKKKHSNSQWAIHRTANAWSVRTASDGFCESNSVTIKRKRNMKRKAKKVKRIRKILLMLHQPLQLVLIQQQHQPPKLKPTRKQKRRAAHIDYSER